MNIYLKYSTSNQFRQEEEIITDPHVIASKFNEYFINVGPNLAKKIPTGINNHTFKSYLKQKCIVSFFLDPVMEKEVSNEIGHLNKNKSNGHDDISPKVVKDIATYIVKPLTHIFNLSFLTGIIPDTFKIALVHVTPVYNY